MLPLKLYTHFFVEVVELRDSIDKSILLLHHAETINMTFTFI